MHSVRTPGNQAEQAGLPSTVKKRVRGHGIMLQRNLQGRVISSALGAGEEYVITQSRLINSCSPNSAFDVLYCWPCNPG